MQKRGEENEYVVLIVYVRKLRLFLWLLKIIKKIDGGDNYDGAVADMTTTC